MSCSPPSASPHRVGGTRALEIWWDPICPWCYLGLLDLEATLAAVPSADRPTITWRAFELDPSADRVARRTALEVMAEHEPREAVLERLVRVGSLAAAHGVTLNTASAHPVSSYDAHRVALLAQDRGRFQAVAKRLLHAYHTENRTIADRDVLVELCEHAGLDRAEVAAMLRTSAWSDRVAADQKQAERVGLRGVPGVLVDGRQPHGLVDWLAGARRRNERTQGVPTFSGARAPSVGVATTAVAGDDVPDRLGSARSGARRGRRSPHRRGGVIS